MSTFTGAIVAKIGVHHAAESGVDERLLVQDARVTDVYLRSASKNELNLPAVAVYLRRNARYLRCLRAIADQDLRVIAAS